MREVVQCWRLHSHCLCLLICILGSRQTLQLGFSRGADARTRREYLAKGRALSNAIESTFHSIPGGSPLLLSAGSFQLDRHLTVCLFPSLTCQNSIFSSLTCTTLPMRAALVLNSGRRKSRRSRPGRRL